LNYKNCKSHMISRQDAKSQRKIFRVWKLLREIK